MTFAPTEPAETEPRPPLQPGESRRAAALLADEGTGTPTPGGSLAEAAAAEEVCPAGAAYAPPPLERPALFLTLRGRAEARVGAHILAHRPGSLAAVAAGCRIEERVASEQPWHVVCLMPTGPWADDLDAWLRRRDPAALVLPSASAACRSLMTELVELALSQPSGWLWPFTARAAELLGRLYTETPAAPGEALLQRLARRMDDDPAARPSLGELAAAVGLTPRQLLYRFGKAAGEPLAGWTRRRRIALAQRLLGQGHSVAEVAERLGYANPYHFSRAFKSVAGVPPSVVRDAARDAWRRLPYPPTQL